MAFSPVEDGGSTAMRLRELLALIPEPENISRRGALLGLSAAIAAPFVIRTPGLLMPVRNRIIRLPIELGDGYDSLFRDWQKHPATLEEYRQYCREREEAANGPVIFYNYSVEGFNRIGAMIDAERRYRAMGLL
jgi:hypothetical protein